MTLAELAKLSCTSVSTVSKAFSGSAEISEATKERIFSVAKEHGCFDKYYKGPRERKIIAILCPETESEYYGIQIGLLEREFSARGADSVIFLTRFDPEREARAFNEMVYRLRVDGVVLIGTGSLVRNPDGIPLVNIGQRPRPESRADTISINMKSAMDELIKTVKDFGYRRIAFIGEPLTASHLRTFKSSMRRFGLPVNENYIVTAEARFAEAGRLGMETLLLQKELPEVVICSYDQIAFGAMSLTRERGYRIPDDICFVGKDDVSATDYLDVPLASIHTHTEDMCKQIADLIFHRIDNRHYRERENMGISSSLNLRSSLIPKKDKRSLD
jgi:DNA-binding LacI/PurR family transcriptional regulator